MGMTPDTGAAKMKEAMPNDRPEEAVENGSAAVPFRFDRVELAGSLGDLGTLLPIVIGMILINQLSPTPVFLAFGLFYLLTGFYYRLPVPVQPLKAVGAIPIAYPAEITESESLQTY